MWHSEWVSLSFPAGRKQSAGQEHNMWTKVVRLFSIQCCLKPSVFGHSVLTAATFTSETQWLYYDVLELWLQTSTKQKQSNQKKLCCSYHCCTLHSFGSFFCFNNNKALTFHPSITLSLAGRKSPWIQTKTFKLTALKTFIPVLDSVSSLNVTCLKVVSPKGKHPF